MEGRAPRARCSMPGPPWPRVRALLRLLLLLRVMERPLPSPLPSILPSPLPSPRPLDRARGAVLLPWVEGMVRPDQAYRPHCRLI